MDVRCQFGYKFGLFFLMMDVFLLNVRATQARGPPKIDSDEITFFYRYMCRVSLDHEEAKIVVVWKAFFQECVS